MNTAAKVRTRAVALDWRHAQSGAVVFTNGVFDLLHPGHLALLEAARSEGDALVVGVNSDASVRRLGKSPHRPIVPEAARARMLAGFAAVDCVVLFDEDTPLALIQALSPDVLVKGADYALDQIVGAAFVQSYGGRVETIDQLPGRSTSSLVERVLARYGADDPNDAPGL